MKEEAEMRLWCDLRPEKVFYVENGKSLMFGKSTWRL